MTDPFDYRNPDYTTVIRARADRIRRMRERPEIVPQLRRYYRDNPAQFITDYGCTSDPRNIDVGLPVNIPFILFPRQVEWVAWVLERWRAREFGVNPKSRELGVSWLAVSLASTLACFYDDMAIGFGSRKLELVDNGADPKSLFWKVRSFLEMLPAEFNGGWNAKRHSTEGIIRLPHTGATITGEGGDNIGRGGRTAIYFVDEAAYVERPGSIDASLSATTNCRIDVSSARGMNNPFAEKVHRWPPERVFRFHWRDDPRKDDAWYEKQKENLDPVTLAQEVDMDFAASVEGIVIPPLWVQSAIDAHIKLGIKPSGERRAALDVADEGKDANAMAAAHGILVTHLEQWSGLGSDIFATTQKAFGFCEEWGLSGFMFDSDGLGAGVRGDARVINELRDQQGQISGRVRRPLIVTPWRGSAGVINPESQDVPGRTNGDYFMNLKAQSWSFLSRRFRETYRALTRPDYKYDPTMIISIPSDLPHRADLVAELSQPTWGPNTIGKMVVNKAPDEARSPNLADAVMILMGRHRRAMVISEEAMRAA